MVLGRGGHVQADAVGIALCLTSGFVYALYASVNKHLVRRGSPATVTLGVFGAGAVIAVPIAWAWVGPLTLSMQGWAVVAFLGVVAPGIASLLRSAGQTSELQPL